MSIKFRPVRGKEEEILNQEITNGYLYLATDTGRIFLDTSDNRVSVGGGAGASLFYAEAADKDIQKISEDTSDKNYLLPISSLENPEVLPKKNDLILNSDGSFFKILSFEGNQIHCLQLTVSGSGSGGGGGVVQIEDLSLTIDTKTISRGMTLIQGQDYYISVTGTSTTDDYVSLFFKFSGDNGYVQTRTVTVPSGVPYQLNTNFLPVNNNIKLTVEVNADNTRMTTLPTKVISELKVVEMAIRKVSGDVNAAIALTSSINLSYYAIGSSSWRENLHVIIDGVETITESNITPSSSESKSITIPTQPHGTHTIELKLSTVINGVTMYSNSILYELAWIEASNMTPVIWTENYDKTVVQYDNFTINYQVFDPASSANGKDDAFIVYIYKKGTLFSEVSRKYMAGTWLTLDLTESYDTGENQYVIACGASSKTISFYVTTEGSRDLELVKSENLLLNLSATGRSNNEIAVNRGVWASGEHYKTVFDNFNWYSNGWKNDNDKMGSYLSLTNGANIKIPFLDYTGINPRPFSFNNGTDNYSFEIRFRIKNVQEYSTLVSTIPFYYYYLDGVLQEKGISINDIKQRQANGENIVIQTDEDGNWIMDRQNSQKTIKSTEGVCMRILNEDTENGLCIGTQEAYFRSPEGVTSVRYKEDEIINLSVVVSSTDRLASIYLNGILSGSLKLGASSFNIGNKIEFNSDYCDIDIYKIRFYKYGLTMPEVIHNYISDIHNIALYDQNQLTREGNSVALSYTKLVNYNQKMLDEGKINELTMPYAVFEIIDNEPGMVNPNGTSSTDDKLPWKKGNNRYCKITFVNPALDAAYNAGLIDEAYYETHSPSYECIGADINVQGTSSQGYPRRNYKTKMKSAVNKKDANGVSHEDWGWRYTNEKFINYLESQGKKSSFKKWKQDNPKYGTNKFTWKIDYMESSGSYNTGFANLMGNHIYSAHPLRYYNIPEFDDTGLRTTVYGFPVLTFHKHSTAEDKAKIGTPIEDEIYEYIGRYNLNQDKGSDELFGFSLDIEQPYVTKTKVENGETIEYHPTVAEVAECWEMTDNQGTWTSFSYPSNVVKAQPFATRASDNEDRLEVIKHYECRYHKNIDFIEVIASDENPYDLTTVQQNINAPDIDSEERDIWNSISTVDGMNNYIVNNWSNWERFVTWCDSTDTRKANPEADLPSPVTYPITSYYQKVQVSQSDRNPETIYYYNTADENTSLDQGDISTENNYIVIEENESLDNHKIIYELRTELDGKDQTGVSLDIGQQKATFTKDTAVYRLMKFKKEFDKHLNLDYCAIYFVMTELLLCYDSRGKNMMMASYGPKEENGDYIWFPIFYDIDTQLGLNNIGATLWDYDTDATREQAFSTPSSVLWVNFLACFEDYIKSTYATLRSNNALSYEAIEGAYLCSPNVFDSYAMKGLRPMIAIGLDEYYKYIAPTITGYYDTKGELVQDTNNSYAYAINGDRMLSRELLLRNRLNYLDSYWVAGDYTPAGVAQGGIRMRANANNQNTSDKYLDSASLSELPSNHWEKEVLQPYPVQYYDATPEFEITPFLNQYVFTYNDKQPNGEPVKYQGTPVLTRCGPSVTDGYKKTPGFPEQIVIVPAEDYISSLGDLSLKYLSQFTLIKGKRILDLNIGSDAPDYFNSLLGAGTGQFNINDAKKLADGTLNPNTKALLKTINLTNVTSLADYIDMTGSEKLRECRALGTKLQYVLFAEGAPLDTIHLPKTVQQISLTEARELTRILTEKPQVFGKDRDSYTGLYIEGVTDFDKNAEISDEEKAEMKFNQINIIGGSLGYDSYELLDRALQFVDAKGASGTRLKINLENVEWSPYIIVEYGTPYNSETSYYYLTDHNTFTPFEFTTDANWKSLTLNGKIFTFDSSLPQNKITSLEILDKFLSDYQRAEQDGRVENYYTNNNSSLGYPNITGSIYVSNENGEAINEAELTSKYGVWNKLNIYAAKMNKSNIAKFVNVLDSGKEEVVDKKGTNENKLPLTSNVPIKTGYDFIGWSTSLNEEDLVFVYEDSAVKLKEGQSWPEFSEENNIDTIVLYAIFKKHEYTITYYLDNNNTLFETIKVPYGETIVLPSTIPYIDDSHLSQERTFKFLGYSSSKEANLWVNPESIVQEDMSLYCKFEEVSVRENVDESLFNFIPNYTYNADDEGTVTGWLIEPNVALKGKITIPTYHTVNNVRNKVIACRGFSGQTGLTHVFVQNFETSGIVEILKDCFNGDYGLKYCELLELNSLRRLGNACFQGCSNLENSYIGGANLQYIGAQAFTQAFKPGTSYNLQIASSVKTINFNKNGVFYNCQGNLDTVNFGTSQAPTQWNIDLNGLQQTISNNSNYDSIAPIIWRGNTDASFVRTINIYTDNPAFFSEVLNYEYNFVNNSQVNLIFGTSQDFPVPTVNIVQV